MFRLFGLRNARLLSAQDDQAELRMRRQLTPNSEHTVRIHHEGRSFACRILVLDVRQEGGKWIHSCQMLEPTSVPDRGRERRRGSRYPVNWKVLSRELPGGEAVTTDVSLSGMQLQTSGEVELGAVVKIYLRELNFVAVVSWCRPYGDHYLTGVQLERFDGTTRAALEEMLRESGGA